MAFKLPAIAREWVIRFWGTLSRRRRDRELEEELRLHLELAADDEAKRSTLPPGDARRAAAIRLGGMSQSLEALRDQRGVPSIEALWRDIRYAIHTLRRSPGFTAVAILILTLGIGANTALFSIFSSLILRPLPVRDPGSLVLLTNGSWSYPVWQEIHARQASFAGAFAWSPQDFDLSPTGQSDVVDGAFVSGQLFEALGVSAWRGRMITSADDDAQPDGPVAVISNRLWRQRFGASDDVIGRQLTVQRVAFTIVGVMPPGFFGADVGQMTDVALPFSTEPLIRGKESRLASADSIWLQIMVRLKPEQSLDQANAALRAAQSQILEDATRGYTEPLTLAPAANGRSTLRTRFETPLFAMVVAVGLVLLVACANIATLLMARALARRHEFNVRLALGSPRWRITRLLFVETLILAVAGAGFGLMFASWSSALLVHQLNTWQSTVSLDLFLDWRVLTFTVVLSLLSTLTASLAPMHGLRRVSMGDALKDSGRAIGGDRRFAARSTLVVIQVALSLVLVVAAGLFLRTFVALQRLPLGFVPEPLVVVELNLQTGGGPPEERGARVERLRDAAAAVPGVRAAAVSFVRLLTGGGWASSSLGVGDLPPSPLRPRLWLNATTPGWFATMGMPLRSGRDFEADDRLGAMPVAIVNQAFVAKYLRGEQALGQIVRLGADTNPRRQIVGVVGDAVYATPRDGLVPTMYIPVAQQSPRQFFPVVLLTINAGSADRAGLERDLAAALTRTDPAVGFTFGTFDQLVDATVTQERLVALISAFFGALALLLAGVGLYGVVAHEVRTQRTEIALRLALGATPSSIVWRVFRHVAALLAVGLALGLTGSLLASRFVQSLLFDLQARDPWTLVTAVIVLGAAAGIAAWMPVRSAARLDPATVLREG